MLWEEVDMIGNHHQVANLKAWVHTTGSVRDEESLDAQLVHDAHREGDLLHRVALVVVEAALHCHDIHTAKLTEDEFATMTFDGRDRKVWYLTIGNLQCVSYF